MAISYAEKLSISVTSIDKVKEIIKTNIKNTITSWKNNIDLEKQTFHIIGPAGVGKTQICNQICNEISQELKINFKHIIIKGPVLSRDDFLCPFPEKDQDGKLTGSFKMLFSDFIPREKDTFGLLTIDEFSRADHNLQQLLWQIINENKIHSLDFPKGWFTLSLDNPDDGSYSMNYLEDAAGLRRACHIYVDVNTKAFLSYAKEKRFHKHVIDFIESNPSFLYDFESQRNGKVFANPASWERVSNILIGYENTSGINCDSELVAILSGLLNTHIVRIFKDYITNSEIVKPEEILNLYNEKVKNFISTMKDKNENLKLSMLMSNFMKYLSDVLPELSKKEIENIKNFLLDLPRDIASSYFSKIESIRTSNISAYLYLIKLQVELSKYEDFNREIISYMSKTCNDGIALRNKMTGS